MDHPLICITLPYPEVITSFIIMPLAEGVGDHYNEATASALNYGSSYFGGDDVSCKEEMPRTQSYHFSKAYMSMTH
jgi:hypothetical protein